MKRNNFWHNVPRNAEGQTATPPPAPEPAPAPAVDLSFIPTDFHKDGAPDLAAFQTHYQEVIARDAQRAERDATIPEAYEFGLPDGFTYAGIEGLPEDFSVNLTPDDPTMKPLYDEVGTLLKEIGAPGDAGKKLMGVFAKYEAVQYAQSVTEMKADLAKLGTQAQVEARVGTLARAIETRLPADEATALKSLLRTSGAIKAVERLLTPARGTVSAPAAPPGPNTEGMTASQKLALANAQSR
jgi:hypothetical protein